METEEVGNRLTVADIQLVVRKVSSLATETLQVPRRIAIKAEEGPAHIVVDAVDLPAQLIEEHDGLGPNEAAASRHNDSLHVRRPPFTGSSVPSSGCSSPATPDAVQRRGESNLRDTLQVRQKNELLALPSSGRGR